VSHSSPAVVEEERTEVVVSSSPKDILEEPTIKKPFNAEVVHAAKKTFPSQT
jgi:hypothetical protein